jgi:hypothetical protein
MSQEKGELGTVHRRYRVFIIQIYVLGIFVRKDSALPDIPLDFPNATRERRTCNSSHCTLFRDMYWEFVLGKDSPLPDISHLTFPMPQEKGELVTIHTVHYSEICSGNLFWERTPRSLISPTRLSQCPKTKEN